MSVPVVIDIYHGDPVVNFAKTKESGILGVIHKASQGGASVDLAYSTRRKLAKEVGLLWGAYHFFDFSAPAAFQAEHFLSVAAPDDSTLITLDWENVGNREPSAALAREFLQVIEAKLGRKAVLYSGNVAKEQIRGIDEYFASHRLWLCQYGAHFVTQESWKNAPWLWQNNGDNLGPGPHHIPGIGGLCDNNCLVGDMTPERLVKEWAQ